MSLKPSLEKEINNVLCVKGTLDGTNRLLLELPGNTHIGLDENYSWAVGVSRVNYNYSIQNIKSSLVNHTFQYYNGSSTRTVTLADGCYDISDIQAAMELVMVLNSDTINIFLSTHAPTGKTAVVITLASSYTVTFNSALAVLLGYANPTTVSVSGVSASVQNLFSGVTDLKIHAEFARNTELGPVLDRQLVATLPFAGNPGDILNEELDITYIKFVGSDGFLEQAYISVTDQDNNPVDLGPISINITFKLRGTLLKKSDNPKAWPKSDR